MGRSWEIEKPGKGDDASNVKRQTSGRRAEAKQRGFMTFENSLPQVGLWVKFGGWGSAPL